MLKNTKTRSNVLNILQHAKEPLSPSAIFEQLKDKKITLSSIYRTLETFTKEGLIIKDMDQKGTAMYAIFKENHCHYLECKKCHQKIELQFCPYHKINSQINKKYNFQVDEHNMVIYGICEKCKKC